MWTKLNSFSNLLAPTKLNFCPFQMNVLLTTVLSILFLPKKFVKFSTSSAFIFRLPLFLTTPLSQHLHNVSHPFQYQSFFFLSLWICLLYRSARGLVIKYILIPQGSSFSASRRTSCGRSIGTRKITQHITCHIYYHFSWSAASIHTVNVPSKNKTSKYMQNQSFRPLHFSMNCS